MAFAVKMTTVKISVHVCTLCFSLLLVPVYAFQGDISISGDSVIGGNVTITCSWTLAPGESFLSLTFRTLPVTGGQDYFYYQFQMNSAVSEDSLKNVRMSRDQFNVSSNQAVVRIAGLQCADEKNYSCYVVVLGTSRKNTYHDFFHYLSLKDHPMIALQPKSIHPADDYAFYYETTRLTATCSATVGQRGLGSLEWRLYIGDKPEYIKDGDTRIQPLELDELRPGDENCSERVKQSFVIKLTMQYQELVVACFVQNPDFANKTREFCNKAEDMCNRSSTIWIISKQGKSGILLELAIAFMALIGGIIVCILVVELYARKCKKAPRQPPPPPQEPVVEPPPESAVTSLPEVASTSDIEEENESVHEDTVSSATY